MLQIILVSSLEDVLCVIKSIHLTLIIVSIVQMIESVKIFKFVGCLDVPDFISTCVVYLYRKHLVGCFVIFSASKSPQISQL